MEPLPEAGLLTKEDLATYAGTSVHTIAKWNTRGTGPKRVRIGRRVYYRRADVLAWVDGLETK